MPEINAERRETTHQQIPDDSGQTMLIRICNSRNFVLEFASKKVWDASLNNTADVTPPSIAMKALKVIAVMLAFALSALNDSALAARGGGGRSGSHNGGHYTHAHGHSHSSVGVFFGPVWYPPYYYYPPYPYYPYYPYYYPPVVASPPTYIEQGSSQPLASGYWYYCNSSGAYYPYVKECPAGWQQVAPTPAQ